MNPEDISNKKYFLSNVIFEKSTQTLKYIDSNISPILTRNRLPLPRDFERHEKGSLQVFEFCQLLQNPGNSKDITIIKESLTEEIHHHHSDLESDDATSDRFRYCREVIKPYLKDYPDDCPTLHGHQERLIRDALDSAQEEFPDFQPCLDGPQQKITETIIDKAESSGSKNKNTAGTSTSYSSKSKNSSSQTIEHINSDKKIVSKMSEKPSKQEKPKCPTPVKKCKKEDPCLDKDKAKGSQKQSCKPCDQTKCEMGPSCEVLESDDTDIKKKCSGENKPEKPAKIEPKNCSQNSNFGSFEAKPTVNEQQFASTEEQPELNKTIKTKPCSLSDKEKSGEKNKSKCKKKEKEPKQPCSRKTSKSSIKEECAEANSCSGSIFTYISSKLCSTLTPKSPDQAEVPSQPCYRPCPKKPKRRPKEPDSFVPKEFIEANKKTIDTLKFVADDLICKAIKVAEDPESINRAKCTAEEIITEVREIAKEVCESSKGQHTVDQVKREAETFCSKVRRTTKEVCQTTKDACELITCESKKYLGFDDDKKSENRCDENSGIFSGFGLFKSESQRKRNEEIVKDVKETATHVCKTVDSAVTIVTEHLNNYLRDFNNESSSYDKPNHTSKCPPKEVSNPVDPPPELVGMLTTLKDRIYALFSETEEKQSLSRRSSLSSFTSNTSEEDADDAELLRRFID